MKNAEYVGNDGFLQRDMYVTVVYIFLLAHWRKDYTKPAQISLMMDHINSYKRPDLGDKSPYEMFEFYYGRDILDILGVHRISPNEIVLKPELLRR